MMTGHRLEDQLLVTVAGLTPRFTLIHNLMHRLWIIYSKLNMIQLESASMTTRASSAVC